MLLVVVQVDPRHSLPRLQVITPEHEELEEEGESLSIPDLGVGHPEGTQRHLSEGE